MITKNKVVVLFTVYIRFNSEIWLSAKTFVSLALDALRVEYIHAHFQFYRVRGKAFARSVDGFITGEVITVDA